MGSSSSNARRQRRVAAATGDQTHCNSPEDLTFLFATSLRRPESGRNFGAGPYSYYQISNSGTWCFSRK